MKVIEVDLTGCKYLAEIHERIRIAFGFPKWYGKNWSAFGTYCGASVMLIK